MTTPEFTTKEERIKWVIDNMKDVLFAKKNQTKEADAVIYFSTVSKEAKECDTDKEGLNDSQPVFTGNLKAELIINTTNILDSHQDVHIPGIWKKSISETKSIYLIQEHQMKFDKIITDNVTVSTKMIAWSKLGHDFEGKTEALIFDCIISPDRNPFMFDQYSKKYVKNHSVGMRYVQMFFCVNSEEKYYAEYKDNWDKYIGYVANVDEVNEQGCFWAVTEAKVVEGSAVVCGSNRYTPVYSISEEQKSSETSKDTTVAKNKYNPNLI